MRRQTNAGASDSLHLYLHRRRITPGVWSAPCSTFLTTMRRPWPMYAAPAAFAGRRGRHDRRLPDLRAGDLPADAPRPGQWVLRDSSGASVWVRNASADLTQGLLDGSEVQVFGLLKMEQGWPFLEVRFVQALPAAGS
ncbi:hypothetical protein [Candidatus Amarolinea dominans]|uniref:hypothetical protein n=1 Tax=Candidatus Amarolinea dominans TaxID=3140696 RepID=UPI003136E033|nr:hypothetical protein [Anaerolineae bacterium]